MKKKRFLSRIVFIVIGFVLFNLIWLLCALLLDIKALPSPLSVYGAYSKALDNNIVTHLQASFGRVAISLIISSIIAVVVGIAMGFNKTVNKLLGPLLYFSYPIPKLALLPIVMILFGVDEASKIIIIVLIIVFQQILSVRDAVLGIPREDYAVLTSLGASDFDKMKHITFPAFLPAFLSSLRVSVGIAVSALFFTETFGTDEGLGFYITDSWMRIDYIQMYFGILSLSLMGFFIFLVFDLVEHYFCKWRNV